MLLKRTFVLALSFVIFIATLANADIVGKVVSVADGDTITVLQDRTQHRIRLYGIDCPESHQDFGNKATQLASELVFGKQVRVDKKDMDRYGRVVGVVYVNGLCVNEELVRKGMAWVYRRYCTDAVCNDWLKLEQKARGSSIGLWSHPDPIEPWDFRRGKRGPVKDNTDVSVYHGNTRSMVFHQPACKHFNCKNCTAIFATREEAINAGYRPCGGCGP